MWDNVQKVGVLSDFDLAKFEDQTGVSGRDNTGTLPFMALDLVSERDFRREIPRRYRRGWTRVSDLPVSGYSQK